MSAFNLNRLREYIPKDIPQVKLPRLPSWSNRSGDSEDAQDATLEDDDLDEDARYQDSPSMTIEDPTPIDTARPKSYLDLINECDNFPYFQTDPKSFLRHINTYYGLYVHDHPETELGYILPSVAETFRGLPDWKINDDERSLTLMAGSSEAERSEAIAAATQAMRATDHFAVLKGWRDELYPVYGPDGVLLFSIERAASALFGIVTYGCHMTAYTRTGEGAHREMKIWVPRRAATKQTYGGMLDNTVAGGLSTGETPLECIIREAQEEASLSEELVRKGLKAAGTVTYFHIRDRRAGGETKLLQPEIQYVYDLELNENQIPKPSDDEVEEFGLMTVEEVKQALREGQFKPNCALVLVDFFIRHGMLTAEDKGFIEIVARLHRRFEFPTI